MIELAASREAARTGQAEVGFEQLLLGVLVNGGPGARLLMDAGVGLAEARSAIDALVREDLALLGIDAAPPALGPGAPELLPLSPRLREIVDDCPSAEGDGALIAALIDDGGGRVRRLLDRLGVDTDRIRRELGDPDRTPEPEPAAAGGPDTADAAPEGWEYTVYRLEVPVSVARVWAVVGDPDRRAEWEANSTGSRRLGDGSVELLREGEPTYSESITHSVPGRTVTWTRADRSGAPRTLRIDIEPVGEHARLHLRMGWPNALRGRIANRVVRWIARQQLRFHAQGITQAAAS
ncbi:Clp protease N-terminal domain-containing protein [Allonocardiopsis opalescens]|nr:Clp protease N-terminal domain-containing protein [Allonocardiopsis opalescens]